jgi:hypothetical protein
LHSFTKIKVPSLRQNLSNILLWRFIFCFSCSKTKKKDYWSHERDTFQRLMIYACMNVWMCACVHVDVYIFIYLFIYLCLPLITSG